MSRQGMGGYKCITPAPTCHLFLNIFNFRDVGPTGPTTEHRSHPLWSLGSCLQSTLPQRRAPQMVNQVSLNWGEHNNSSLQLLPLTCIFHRYYMFLDLSLIPSPFVTDELVPFLPDLQELDTSLAFVSVGCVALRMSAGEMSDNLSTLLSDSVETLLSQHIEAALWMVSMQNAVRANPMPTP